MSITIGAYTKLSPSKGLTPSLIPAEQNGAAEVSKDGQESRVQQTYQGCKESTYREAGKAGYVRSARWSVRITDRSCRLFVKEVFAQKPRKARIVRNIEWLVRVINSSCR
ncbi:uncharacterized protein FA14DRAFT_179783 [Meira miltonrushii]|uniref:Uncharacterized protein n=1 Tax=Meira miltonrushii TaxID=1280837 RepID=A0A316VFL7_9BASI|nr:uncharacterized protein FA14DRAFT_179783 [Meira miltonrushii]PWN36427.1 hypothetical protein FA14DRAFT_179783 [Meira miltonrushii]